MQHSEELIEWAEDQMSGLAAEYDKRSQMLRQKAIGFLNIVGNNEERTSGNVKVGTVRGGDWLILTILEGEQFMPSLRRMREIWETAFDAADGRKGVEMGGGE